MDYSHDEDVNPPGAGTRLKNMFNTPQKSKVPLNNDSTIYDDDSHLDISSLFDEL
jgi:hypothetical protein